jgi:Chitin binding Peritrophin-A domain
MNICLSFILSLVVAVVSANRCVDRPNLTKLPSRESCAHYSLCFNGVETKLECDQSSMYDYEREQCMPTHVAKCYSETLQTQCPATGLTYQPDPESCEQYIICMNGEVIHRTCADGLHWSAKKNNCLRPDLAKCEQPAVVEDLTQCPAVHTPGTVVYLPSTESCSVFYVCFRGEAIGQECASGMHWEQKLSMCVPAGQSSCQVGRTEYFDYYFFKS